jgi:pyruvate/2-oxoglutarate dehydrogenase complex dihydrolipoamide acyltransferase (E2) component
MQVSVWFAHVGERVFAGDRMVELLLGAATFDVAAPCSGQLVEQVALAGDRPAIGQVLGYVEED